jgi:hypothetical protein
LRFLQDQPDQKGLLVKPDLRGQQGYRVHKEIEVLRVNKVQLVNVVQQDQKVHLDRAAVHVVVRLLDIRPESCKLILPVGKSESTLVLNRNKERSIYA